jgi:hypothetical protein
MPKIRDLLVVSVRRAVRIEKTLRAAQRHVKLAKSGWSWGRCQCGEDLPNLPGCGQAGKLRRGQETCAERGTASRSGDLRRARDCVERGTAPSAGGQETCRNTTGSITAFMDCCSEMEALPRPSPDRRRKASRAAFVGKYRIQLAIDNLLQSRISVQIARFLIYEQIIKKCSFRPKKGQKRKKPVFHGLFGTFRGLAPVCKTGGSVQ